MTKLNWTDVPYISTLRKVQVPAPSELVLLRPCKKVKTSVEYRLRRHVLVAGQSVGHVLIAFNSPEPMPKDLSAPPYFDPVTKQLGLQGQDGRDIAPRKDLHHLASHARLRPLLQLAVAEGLLGYISGK